MYSGRQTVSGVDSGGGDIELEEELIELVEENEVEEIILLEEEGLDEGAVSEEEIELLAEDEAETIELEEDEEVTPPTRVEAFSGVDKIDAGLLDFLADYDSGVVSFDDEIDLEEDTGDPTVIRVGVDIPVTDSIQQLIMFASTRLEFLEKSINSNNSYTDSSRDLLYSVMGSREIDFLTTEDQSRLFTLVEGYESGHNSTSEEIEQQVVRVFTQSRKLDKRQTLELSTYVRQVVGRYRNYLDRTAVLNSIKSATNKFLMQSFIGEANKGLATLKAFAGSQDVCYVKRIKVMGSGNLYTCGNCEEQHVVNQDFFKMVISEKSGFSKNEHITLFPLAQICASCGNLNVFTILEHQELNAHFNSKYETLMSDWRKSTRKLASFGNLIVYDMQMGVMPKVKPDLYELEEAPPVEEVVIEEFNYELMNKWYERTKNTIDVLNTKTVNRGGGLILNGTTFDIDLDDFRSCIHDVTRLYCNFFREDYDRYRVSAINSLLGYFKDNPVLMNRLSIDYVYKYEAYSMYGSYVDGTLSLDEAKVVFPILTKELGIAYEEYTEGEELNDLTKSVVEEELRIKLAEAVAHYESMKEQQQIALNSIKRLGELYRFVEIKATAMLDIRDFEGLLVNEGMVEWISHTADLMIINRISETIMDFWKTLSIKRYKNKSVVVENKRSTKTSKELIFTMLKTYDKYYKEIGEVYSVRPNADNFLSASPVMLGLLNDMYNLKSSVDTYDYFSFAHSVVKLHKTFYGTADIMYEFKNMLAENIDECQKFCEEIAAKSTGNKYLDYYIYHYEHLFTEEEIREAASDLHVFMKNPYYLKREEGENFSTYYKRLRDSNPNEEDTIVDKDAAKFQKNSKHYPIIFGVFEYYRSCSMTKGRYRNQVLMSDLVYYSYHFGKRAMFSMLGLTKVPLPTEKPIDWLARPDSLEYKYNFMLQEFVYTSPDYNTVALGNGEDFRTVAELIEEDPSTASEQFKYFGSFGAEVFEHYSS